MNVLSRSKRFSALLRSLAVMALVSFVGAQAACWVHCHFAAGPRDSAPSCCSKAAAKACHSGKPLPSVPSQSTACSTLMTLLPGDDAPRLVAHEPETPSLLTALTLPSGTAPTLQAPPRARPTGTGGWVFTPLVCLGPAFHSLAPPFDS